MYCFSLLQFKAYETFYEKIQKMERILLHFSINLTPKNKVFNQCNYKNI
ncbi:hypothetical protein bthur0013_57160 [Bacillus thuringiensis IBL 200]|nr:hypothetical protein bthur0013_57160 [Bacillus thuringiensis IBL 200]